MVLQKPCVFPKSIKENVLFGIQHYKKLSEQKKQEIFKKPSDMQTNAYLNEGFCDC